LKFKIPLSFLRSKPLLSEICFVVGFSDVDTLKGDLPFFVRITTRPAVISPNSTDGTPVITSIDSKLEAERLRVSTPEVVPDKLLFGDSLIPSTSTAVPKLPFPSPPLMLNTLCVIRLGLTVLPPGNKLMMSVGLIT
jgi:hypothetical protein